MFHERHGLFHGGQPPVVIAAQSTFIDLLDLPLDLSQRVDVEPLPLPHEVGPQVDQRVFMAAVHKAVLEAAFGVLLQFEKVPLLHQRRNILLLEKTLVRG